MKTNPRKSSPPPETFYYLPKLEALQYNIRVFAITMPFSLCWLQPLLFLTQALHRGQENHQIALHFDCINMLFLKKKNQIVHFLHLISFGTTKLHRKNLTAGGWRQRREYTNIPLMNNNNNQGDNEAFFQFKAKLSLILCQGSEDLFTDLFKTGNSNKQTKALKRMAGKCWRRETPGQALRSKTAHFRIYAGFKTAYIPYIWDKAGPSWGQLKQEVPYHFPTATPQLPVYAQMGQA